MGYHWHLDSLPAVLLNLVRDSVNLPRGRWFEQWMKHEWIKQQNTQKCTTTFFHLWWCVMGMVGNAHVLNELTNILHFSLSPSLNSNIYAILGRSHSYYRYCTITWVKLYHCCTCDLQLSYKEILAFTLLSHILHPHPASGGLPMHKV